MPFDQILTFGVWRLRVLDEHGVADPELDPQLPDPELMRLYRGMVLAREADQRMLKLQRQGRLGTFAPSTGQEAACCGPVLAMREQDWFVGAYRELGGRLLRGEPLDKTLAYYAGYEEGSSYPPGTRNLPTQIILAAQLLHAVGIAYAARYQGERETAVVAFCGDGATSQGDFHEALNFAGVWRVPVVFVCQNNGWAISTPRSQQTRAETIAQKAIAYGLPGVQVDGNDVLAMYRATRDALERARAGEGPTLIEALTFRLLMHTTADDPRKYRREEEEQEWWQRDPLVRLRRYLVSRGLWDEAREVHLLEEVRAEIDAAVQRLEASRAVKPDAPFDHIFGTPCTAIEEQRAEFLRELAEESADG